MSDIADRARSLAEAGFAVFPVRPDKTPMSGNGLKDATLDPDRAQSWFEKYDDALIGIHCGMSRIVVLDVDYRESEDGAVLVDGYDELEKAWLEIPESFSYPSVSGLGMHVMYRAPSGVNLSPKSAYRKMRGVDRRAGESYVVFTADKIPTGLVEAPTWLCDETTVRSVAAFDGDVKDWFDTLEPGEPNLLVRRAIEDLDRLYVEQSHDLSHSDIVEHQHRAVRLGAEGNPGVDVYLARIEEYALERTGEHSRSTEQYAYEFAEALASGIKKHGAAIELRSSMPEYSASLVPDTVSSSLVFREHPADRADFTRLLRQLVKSGIPQSHVLSVLWNAVPTRDLAREWGLEFVNERIADEMQHASQDPADDPIAPAPSKTRLKTALLTDSEREQADAAYTFIDLFQDMSMAAKGFSQAAYDVPLAWTALSMAAGLGYVIPRNGTVGTNVWHVILGESGSGKTHSTRFFKSVLDKAFNSVGTSYWNAGTGSPEGIERALLERDGLPTATVEDEAGAFYKNLLNKDWMASLENLLARMYDGEFTGANKIGLKDLAGKHATTSYSFCTISTPDDTLKVIDEDMFASGFMARSAWVLGPLNIAVNEEKYVSKESDLSEDGVPVQVWRVASDLAHMYARSVGQEKKRVWGTARAVRRLDRAYRMMDSVARKHPKYAKMLGPAVTRLAELSWKYAALLAIYRGDDEFTLEDALVSLSYVERWFDNLFWVSERITSAYMRDSGVILSYLREHGGRATLKDVKKTFGHLIVRSHRELDDRIDFLVSSGRIRPVQESGSTIYEVTD